MTYSNNLTQNFEPQSSSWGTQKKKKKKKKKEKKKKKDGEEEEEEDEGGGEEADEEEEDGEEEEDNDDDEEEEKEEEEEVLLLRAEIEDDTELYATKRWKTRLSDTMYTQPLHGEAQTHSKAAGHDRYTLLGRVGQLACNLWTGVWWVGFLSTTAGPPAPPPPPPLLSLDPVSS